MSGRAAAWADACPRVCLSPLLSALIRFIRAHPRSKQLILLLIFAVDL
jgi:hypothetical protein